MPKPRNKEHKGLPPRWQQHRGYYTYRPREAEKPFFNNQARFRLSKNLPEAYKIFGERMAQMDRAELEIKTIGQLLDRYALEVTPTKAPATQAGDTAFIKPLRKVFNAVPIAGFKPQWIYKYIDTRDAKSSAHHEVKLLSAVFTKAIEWGIIDTHPIKGQVRLKNPSNKPKRYIEDWEIQEALTLPVKKHRGGTALLQAYIELKLLTGMSQGDLLRLQPANHFTDEGIEITRHKTRNSTGLKTIYEWTPDLRAAVDKAMRTRAVDISPFLFCNSQGQGYMSEESGRPEGFKSLWQRFMKRLLAESKITQRFTEHDLRRKVASDADSLEHAQNLLSHSDSKVTAGVYRVKPVKVKPMK